MPNLEDFRRRIESEAKSMSRITNKDLVCSNCRFRLDDTAVFGNTSRCRRYLRKPNHVLNGKRCMKKEEE